MVGLDAERAVRQAKSSHTAVSKSSQLGQRRLASPSRRNLKKNIFAGLGRERLTRNQAAFPEHANPKEQDTRNALLSVLQRLAKTTFPNAESRDAHLEKAWAASARGEVVLGGRPANPVDCAVLLFRGDSPQ